MSQFCSQVAHCLASQFTLRGLAKLCHIFPVSLQLEGTKQIVPHVSPTADPANTADSAKLLTPERGETTRSTAHSQMGGVAHQTAHARMEGARRDVTHTVRAHVLPSVWIPRRGIRGWHTISINETEQCVDGCASPKNTIDNAFAHGHGAHFLAQ